VETNSIPASSTEMKCEHEDYHLPGPCSGKVYGDWAHAYGHGHIVNLCEGHLANAPDPRRIPSNWDGNPESLLPID